MLCASELLRLVASWLCVLGGEGGGRGGGGGACWWGGCAQMSCCCSLWQAGCVWGWHVGEGLSAGRCQMFSCLWAVRRTPDASVSELV